MSHTTYPDHSAFSYGYTDQDGESWVQDGLTKREYFVAAAMQGIMANFINPLTLKDLDPAQSFPAEMAEAAIVMADALILRLNE